MSREARLAALERLQIARGGSTVITYITAARDNLEAPMAMDVIPLMHRHCQAITSPRDETTIDLFIHSNGGDGTVPWRLVTLLREFCNELNVLVPHRAFSAATLTALGADHVFMHRMGMLGPIDPTVANEFNPMNPRDPQRSLGISVEDVASYISLVKEDVGIHHEDELIQAFLRLAQQIHPLALGNVKRSTSQSRMIGEKLLKSRCQGPQLPDHTVTEIVQKLSSELYYHGHPINRDEARDEIGLTFVEKADAALETAMWDLYTEYETDMRLTDAFMPVQEAIAKNPLAPAPSPDPMHFPLAVVDLDLLRLVYVESVGRCDVFEAEHQVTMRRDFLGTYTAQSTPLRQGWTTE